jgi:hypothetical protein
LGHLDGCPWIPDCNSMDPWPRLLQGEQVSW